MSTFSLGILNLFTADQSFFILSMSTSECNERRLEAIKFPVFIVYFLFYFISFYFYFIFIVYLLFVHFIILFLLLLH